MRLNGKLWALRFMLSLNHPAVLFVQSAQPAEGILIALSSVTWPTEKNPIRYDEHDHRASPGHFVGAAPV